MPDSSIKQRDVTLEKWRRNVDRLLPIPMVVQEAIALLNDEKSGVADLARVIARDEALTAKILRVVNSAFYGLSQRISTVSHATAILGFEQVRLLILGVSLFDGSKVSDRAKAADRQVVWEHSFATAQWAQVIAKELRFQPAEEAFIGGLLHDIGKLVLAIHAPEEFASAIKLSQEKGFSSCEAESRTIGLDHVATGMMISQRWRFPPIFQSCIALHHGNWPPTIEDQPNQQKVRQLIAIVRVANSASRLSSSQQSSSEELQLEDTSPESEQQTTRALAAQVSALMKVPVTASKKTGVSESK
ncbi:MAG: HDOD domain-containing protein [Chloroflexi bacterium]|nr:HDOD domain-containing protein [Chloroflexota bacterium]